MQADLPVCSLGSVGTSSYCHVRGRSQSPPTKNGSPCQQRAVRKRIAIGGCNSSEEYDPPATSGHPGSRGCVPGAPVLTGVLSSAMTGVAISAMLCLAVALCFVVAFLIIAVRSQKLNAAGRQHSLQLLAELVDLASVLVPRPRRRNGQSRLPTSPRPRTRSESSPDGRHSDVHVTAAEVTPIPLARGVDP